MEQRIEGRTVSAEESLNRLNKMQLFFYAVLLAVPVIGLLLGFVIAITIVVYVVSRSKNMMRDLALAAVAIVLGFSGMIGETIWMLSGQVVLAVVADTVLNYLILTLLLDKKLGHVFAKPQM